MQRLTARFEMWGGSDGCLTSQKAFTLITERRGGSHDTAKRVSRQQLSTTGYVVFVYGLDWCGTVAAGQRHGHCAGSSSGEASLVRWMDFTETTAAEEIDVVWSG